MSHNDNDNQGRKAFAEKIENMVGIIQKNIKNHGGNIKLVGIDANNGVRVRVSCGSKDSPEAQEVLETGVKELLKQQVPEVGEVVTVG